MKLFKSKMLAWWQVGILKLCVLSFGLAIGSYWSAFFLPYAVPLLLLAFLLGIYLFMVWAHDDSATKK